MKYMNNFPRAFRTVVAVAICVFGAGEAAAEPACRAGGIWVANANLRANPLNAILYGDLETFVTNNRAQYRAGGDAVRCAAALSQAAMSSAMQLFDPGDIQRRDQIDVQLGTMGIKPGVPTPSGSNMMFGMSIQLARLARALPAAANGDFGPLYTPANDFERMQIEGMVMTWRLLQIPAVRAAYAPMEPYLRQLAEHEYGMILQAAERLANAR